MLLYHGSEKIIKKPEYGLGKKNNDYGRGFYCTESIELAKEWACAGGSDGYGNKYELDTAGLKILDLNSDEYNILNWLALLAKNRTYWQSGSISYEANEYLKSNFLPETDGFDIIKGYRADDSYFSFAQDFVANAISLKKLSQAMKLGKLGEQIVLVSKRAFANIHFTGYEIAKASLYYAKKTERDLAARREYRDVRDKANSINEIFMLDIMREGIKNGDSRLR